MLICLDQRTGSGCGVENQNDAKHCKQCGLPLRFALALHDPGAMVQHYHVIRVIGHGSFGAVYEVEDSRNASASLALKETFDPTSIGSFQSEFAVLSGLQHINLPRYSEMFEADGNGYLVMEFVAGQSLQDILDRQQGPLPESQVLGYALQLCDVLTYLHGQTPLILHRDIKPANVRLTPEGRIKLVDFGLLKQGTQQTRATLRGMGTPAYAPIEQYGNSAQSTDPRSDIYSLGATLYHLLTGHEPPTAPNRIATIPDPLIPPCQLNPNLSPHLNDALLTAMSLTQRDRYADAATFKQALQGLIQPSRAGSATRTRWLAPRLISTEQTQAHPEWVRSVAWSIDGQIIASASTAALQFWRISEPPPQLHPGGQRDQITSIAYSPDGQTVATGDLGYAVRLWRVNEKEAVQLRVLNGHVRPVRSVAFSPDGQVLASAAEDRKVLLWGVGDGRLLHSFTSGDEEQKRLLWRDQKGDPLQTFLTASRDVTSVAFSPSGLTVAVADYAAVRLWRVADGRLLETLEGHRDYIRCIAWCQGGQTLASAGNDKTIRIWRMSDGYALFELADHSGFVSCLACSPDGELLASGSWDRTIRVWDVAQGKLLLKLEAHSHDVTSLAFSPDGQLLASGGRDNLVRLWRVAV